jgi:hypothetical protein
MERRETTAGSKRTVHQTILKPNAYAFAVRKYDKTSI